MKKYLSHFMTALAALSSIATLITFCTQWSLSISLPWYFILVIAAFVLLIASIYACYQVHSPKTITLPIAPGKLTVTIQQADLFEQKGVIVIGVNEYFDTHVGDGVISEKSLHGIFINKYFHDRHQELYQKITDSLKSQGIDPICNCKRRTKDGKTDRYPIGSCAKVRDGENIYVLVAISHFDDNDKASLSKQEYNEVLGKLMLFLENNVESRPVHMPILGSGLTRLDRTNKRILHFMIDSFDFLHSRTIVGGLFVDILSLKNAGINLTQVKNTFVNGIMHN